MIAHLDGRIEQIEDDSIVLDVNGLGFEVQIAKIPGLAIGAQTRIYTVWQFKEDGVTIFGFSSPGESKLFKAICAKVSGVGGKTALALLRGLTPGQIADAVVHEKAHVFKAIPGIGQKTAERIVLELRDMMAEVSYAPAPVGGDKVDEARAALRSLGFSIGEIEKALSGLKPQSMTSEDIIKIALSKLSR